MVALDEYGSKAEKRDSAAKGAPETWGRTLAEILAAQDLQPLQRTTEPEQPNEQRLAS